MNNKTLLSFGSAAVLMAAAPMASAMQTATTTQTIAGVVSDPTSINGLAIDPTPNDSGSFGPGDTATAPSQTVTTSVTYNLLDSNDFNPSFEIISAQIDSAFLTFTANVTGDSNVADTGDFFADARFVGGDIIANASLQLPNGTVVQLGEAIIGNFNFGVGADGTAFDPAVRNLDAANIALGAIFAAADFDQFFAPGGGTQQFDFIVDFDAEYAVTDFLGNDTPNDVDVSFDFAATTSDIVLTIEHTVPEPTTMGLLALGMVGAGAAARRRKAA